MMQEILAAKGGTYWARMLSGNFAKMTTSTPFRDLLHAANLRHGTDSFTSPPKEGVLRIFPPWKILMASAGFEPANLGSMLHLDHRSRYYKRHGFVTDLNHFSVIYPRGIWCYTLLIDVIQSRCTGMHNPKSQCMFQNLTCLVMFTQGINIPAIKSTSRSKCFRSSLSLVKVKILFFSIFATALASSSIINPDFACKWKWLWK